MAAEAPVVTTVSGVSSAVISGNSVDVYGGLAGSLCTGVDNVNFCNSCLASVTSTCDGNQPLCACNETRIYPGLQLTITVNPQEGGGSLNLAAKVDDGTTTGTTINPISRSTTTLTFDWATICSKISGGNATCTFTESKNVTLKIAFDTDGDTGVDTDETTTDVTFHLIQPGSTNYNVFSEMNEGVSDFKAFPGDEKAFLIGPDGTDVLPSLGGFPIFLYGSKAVAMRVYISDENITKAVYNTTLEPVNISITDEGGTLDNNVVDGLENDVRYFFRIAMVDQAGNVVQHFPTDAEADAACGSNGACCTVNTAASKFCPYSATPNEVLGLLTKDLNCFVASVAYGTPLAPALKSFRKFRGNVLMQKEWGRRFVYAYYKYGPYAARYIQDKPLLKAMVRASLWPAYGFTQLTGKIGFTKALATTFAALAIILCSMIFGYKRLFQRG